MRYTQAGEKLRNRTNESIVIDSKNTSCKVTEDHRMWIRSTNKDRWRFVLAKDLVDLKGFQAVSSGYLTGDAQEDLMETPCGPPTKSSRQSTWAG